MEITTEMIRELRKTTGVGILECRKALQEADGDYKKAVDYLRAKGMAKAAKRADRDASDGVIEMYSHGDGRVGVILELNCETDFVARGEAFRKLAHEIALQVAAASPLYVKEEDIPEVRPSRTRDDPERLDPTWGGKSYAQTVKDGPEKRKTNKKNDLNQLKDG